MTSLGAVSLDEWFIPVFLLSHTRLCQLQSKCQVKNLTSTVAAINKNLVKCLHLKKSVPNDA